MTFYRVNIYWEDGDGIKNSLCFRKKINALAYGEEWIKNNFQNKNYNLSESYESLEECLTAWRENREIEWVIEFYFEIINFED